MTTFFRFALTLAVLTSASAVMARGAHHTRANAHAAYDSDSTEGARAFWDNMRRNGS